jgi:hypothetical protein
MANSQLNSPAWCPASPSTKATKGGDYDGLKGTDLKGRTSSSNAVPEKIMEKLPDSGAKVTIK